MRRRMRGEVHTYQQRDNNTKATIILQLLLSMCTFLFRVLAFAQAFLITHCPTETGCHGRRGLHGNRCTGTAAAYQWFPFVRTARSRNCVGKGEIVF